MKKKDYSFIIGNHCALVDGNTLWMISFHMDVLLKIDLEAKRLSGAYRIPGNNIGTEQGHAGMKKKEGKLYLFPNKGKGIYSFDIGSCEFKEIEFVPEEKESKFAFAIIAEYDKYIYFPELWGKGIYRLDSETEKIEKKEFSDDERHRMHITYGNRIVFDRFCQKGNFLYIPVYRGDVVLELDLRHFSYKYYKLSSVSDIHLRTIDRWKDRFILSTIDDERLIWEPNCILERQELHILEGDLRSYYAMIPKSNYEFLLAEWERKAFIGKNGRYKKLPFDYQDNPSYPEHACMQFMALFEYDNQIYFQATSNGQIYRVDADNEEIYEVDIEIPETIRNSVISEILKRDGRGIWNETPLIRLADFMAALGVTE